MLGHIPFLWNRSDVIVSQRGDTFRAFCPQTINIRVDLKSLKMAPIYEQKP